jgi:hypothetical protein
MEPLSLAPDVVEQLVGHPLGRDVDERDDAFGDAHRQNGVARAGPRCRRDLGRGHAHPLGEQRAVRLVLDLLQPAERQGGSRVPVPRETPGLAEELGVRRIAPVDPNEDWGAVVADHGCASPWLTGREQQRLQFDTQLVQRSSHSPHGWVTA